LMTRLSHFVQTSSIVDYSQIFARSWTVADNRQECAGA